MKKIKFFVLLAVVMLCTACHDKLWDSIEDLDSRVTKLEELCKEMNTNISALQTIVSVIQENDFITSIVPIEKGGEVIGYTIMFGKHDPITIYNGEDGKDGANGTNGVDGKDGYTPILGVAKDTDGVYYWTLDGEWLLDAEENKIRVTGRDGKDGADGKDGIDGENGKDGVDGEDGKDGENGKDGQDGKDGVDGEDGKDGQNGINGTNGADGKDGVTPQLKIEEGYWYISYDNGATWTELGRAVGEDGKDGKNGQDGKPGADGQSGKDGVDGDSMFSNVTYDDNNVYFTLTDGSVLIVPRGNSASDFDQTMIDNLVTSLTLEQEYVYLKNIGDRDTIIAITEPFPNSKVIWKSNDTTIAKVNDGIIEAIALGDVIIQVQAGDKLKKIYVQVGGPLRKSFSVGENKYIYFSRGNLQYNSSNKMWLFSVCQYDTITDENIQNAFSFGSSGFGDVMDIFNSSVSQAYYRVEESISNSNYDWGVYNAINNGGNQSNLWRTLTQEEWSYIINERINASSLYGIASVGGINGLILLPDEWSQPNGINFTNGYSNKNGKDYYKLVNEYTYDKWLKMESLGAVFLRTDKTQETGCYWSTYIYYSYNPSSYEQAGASAGVFHFYSYQVKVSTLQIYSSKYEFFNNKQFVRLVQDVK